MCIGLNKLNTPQIINKNKKKERLIKMRVTKVLKEYAEKEINKKK